MKCCRSEKLSERNEKYLVRASNTCEPNVQICQQRDMSKMQMQFLFLICFLVWFGFRYALATFLFHLTCKKEQTYLAANISGILHGVCIILYCSVSSFGEVGSNN